MSWVYAEAHHALLLSHLGARKKTEPWTVLVPDESARIRLQSELQDLGASIWFPQWCTLENATVPPDAQCLTILDAGDTEASKAVNGLWLPRLERLWPVYRQAQAIGFRSFEIFTGVGSYRLAADWLPDAFVDKHKNQRCYIIGNGPSLRQTPMERLKDKITFGANRCYVGFESWGFPFTYWACTDLLQLEQYYPEYAAGLPEEMIKFIPFQYGSLCHFPRQCLVPQSYERLDNPHFSIDPVAGLAMGNSVTYSLMQLAAMMGVSEIVLLGMDHNYPVTMDETTSRPWMQWPKQFAYRIAGDTLAWDILRAARSAARERRQKPHPEPDGGLKIATWSADRTHGDTHFDSRYTKSKQFVAPRLAFIENAYRAAKLWGETHGVRIVNATPGTHLDIFPKIDLEEVL